MCRYGLVGRGCKYIHPKPCSRLMEHGTKGKNGCKKGEKCHKFHPGICKHSLARHECFNNSCRYFHIKGTRRNKAISNIPTPQETDTSGAWNQTMQRPNKLQITTQAPNSNIPQSPQELNFLELMKGCNM